MVLLESCDRLLNGEVKCIQPGRERFSLYAPRPDKQVCECEHSGLKNKKPAYTPLRASSLPDRHRQQTFVLLQRFATLLVQGLDLVAS